MTSITLSFQDREGFSVQDSLVNDYSTITCSIGGWPWGRVQFEVVSLGFVPLVDTLWEDVLWEAVS